MRRELTERLLPIQRQRLAVVMTVFNRWDQTRRLLDVLLPAADLLDVETRVFILDDSSTDATAAGLAAFGTRIVHLLGSDMYWSAGMARAMQVAVEWGADRYLWVNNDVDLEPDALREALVTSKADEVVVGATRSSDDHTITYSALRNAAARPGPVRVVAPGTGEPIHTFNGNFVMLGDQVVKRIGLIDGRFAHALGDLDYGYRVSQKGFAISLLPQPIGRCDRNSVEGTFRDAELPRLQRLRQLHHPKGLPMRSQARYLRKRTRWWPLWLTATYVRVYAFIVVGRELS